MALWNVYKEDYIDLRTKQIWLEIVYKALWNVYNVYKAIALRTKQICLVNCL